jgi:hypothetical protein
MVRYPLSRLRHATSRAVHTRFRCGSVPEELNLAAHRNSPVHCKRYAVTPSCDMGLPQLVGAWFQILLTPLPGFFSPFTRATGSLSVIREYLALGGGPPRFIPDSTWLVLLGCANRKVSEFRLQGFHLVSPRLSKRVRLPNTFVTLGNPCRDPMPRPTTPIRQRLHPWHRIGLGSVPFARRY